MNLLEQQMAEILRIGIANGSYVGVKAEFEAEGTRMGELLRLVDVARRAGAKLAVKIGGCEAIRDLLESKQIGVDYIIAPMVESSYAIMKYDSAITKTYSQVEKEQTKFLFNLETKQTFDNFDAILNSFKLNSNIDGVVFGRNDFAGSLDLGSKGIESEKVTNFVVDSADKCKKVNLEFVVGGGVSSSSLDNLKRISQTHLTRFETRKVLFHAKSLVSKSIKQDLLMAVKFELLWLKNKQEHYFTISKEDESRFKILNDRWDLI